ncbi:MAG: HprK-related kinase A [Inhella sp.]|uniref:HprK-related kinase A n=1 Tax=Inhella sp. TaxID=1921806 RepID=UPI00391B4EB7
MMAAPAPTLDSLGLPGCRDRLFGAGLCLRFGPFVLRLRAPSTAIAEHLFCLYGRHPLAGRDDFVDFDLLVERRWRPHGGWQLSFVCDGERPFAAMPLAHGNPLLEWAMNWCIASQVKHSVLIHAAVLARNGQALVLPAPPGSGKSTLCAALMFRGWRLLTDELALLSLDGSLRLWPLVRGVSLKNRSIDLIRDFDPRARFTAVTHDTVKGSIAHLQPLREHVAAMDEPASPAWVVFPQFQAGADTAITPLPRPSALLDLMGQSFNAEPLGLPAFRALTGLLAQSTCHHVAYGSLDAALAAIEQLTRVDPLVEPESVPVPAWTPTSTPTPANTPAIAPDSDASPQPSDADPLRELLCRPGAPQPPSPAAWGQRVAEARTSGLLALLADRTRERPRPAAAQAHLEAALAVQAQRVRHLRREIAHLAHALEPLDVPWVLLKGAAYLALDLPTARLRSFGDLDLLVRRRDLARVEGALLAAGWIGQPHEDPHDERFYREWSHEVPPVTHVRRGSTVDLHHAIAPPLGRFPVDTERLLAEAPVLPGYRQLRTLQPTDLVLHSALHQRLGGESDRSLRDLLDVQSLLDHHRQTAADFEAQVTARAEALGLAEVWFLTQALRADLLGQPVTHWPRLGLVARLRVALWRPVLATAGGTWHPHRATRTRRWAQAVVYLHAHTLRLPWRLLIPHAWHKLGRRWRAQHAPTEARLEG